jgi:hypothetical protein
VPSHEVGHGIVNAIADDNRPHCLGAKRQPAPLHLIDLRPVDPHAFGLARRQRGRHHRHIRKWDAGLFGMRGICDQHTARVGQQQQIAAHGSPQIGHHAHHGGG